ncbi:MAG: PH domain-containing protein [Selenomonadaceae bacterium]|nr:PH domain-containing protein [Selenomonadaceae bacterium]
MPDLEQVQKQIIDLKIDLKELPKREIKELPNVLWEDEIIQDIVRGLYANGNGILVATNKRLVFVDKGMGWGLRVEDFPYDKITSIQYSTGFISGEIIIYSAGNKAKIDYVTKERCKIFAEHVRAMITEIKENHATPKLSKNSKAADDDLLAKLERLATLKQTGMLTEEEFIAAKAKLLSL